MGNLLFNWLRLKKPWAAKTFRKMRLTFYALILAFAQSYALSGYAQATKLNLKMENSSVREVLLEIENISEFRFLYNSKMVDVERKVSVNFREQTINKALDKLFKNTDAAYRIVDRQVVLYAKSEPVLETAELQLQQQQAVSGKVTDSNGQPLPGVTIVLKGTTTGTITDLDGNYTLTNIPTDATLVFSFVGMRTQEMVVGRQAKIDVRMEEETIGLEEVVAIGYGTMKKSDITGSISSVPMELLRNQPLKNLSDVLQGRVAGMTITKTSGQPGADAKIRIRGANSILGSNAPLYVVDGVIGGSTGSVYDIESVEILKDASATAIYGERASNGVILITTKKATSAEPEIRLSLNTGINFQNTDYPDKMNAVEYAEYVNLLRGSGTFTAAEIDEFRKTGGTNWTDMIMQTGLKNDHNISYSQRINKLGIYLSGRYLDEKGTMINSSIGGNYQLRTNIDFAPNDRLTFNFDLKAHKSESWNGSMSTGGDKSHPLIQSLLWSPTEVAWADEENKLYNKTDKYGALSENPYMTAMEQQSISMSHGIYTTLIGNYKITDWLTYNVTGYAAKSSSQSGNYDNIWLNPADPRASRSSSDGFTWRLINRIELNKTFLDAHNFFLTGVYEAEANESWSISGTGRNMPLSDLARYYKIGMSNLQSASSGFGQSSRLAYLARLNYNYKSRYYFTASYRIDAPSGPTDRKEENKKGAFPSFATSWRISEESFMKGGFFDDLKLRLGWGLTGNPSGFPFTSMSSSNYQFGLGSALLGYVPGTPANPNVKWEKTTQSNVGIDFTILEGKVSLTLDYFNKKTSDLLTKKVLPGYYGYGGGASFTQNLGQIDNNGYEATLNYKPVQTRNFYWGLNFNISAVKNKIIDLGEQEAFLTGTAGNGFLDVSTYRVEEGLALGTMWGYKFLGIWSTNESEEAAKYGAKPGDPKWEDVNKDYAIDLSNDGQKIGDANPDFIWGLSNAFSYKNFDLDITLQGMHGQNVFNLLRAAMSTVHPDSRTILLKDPAFNYWTPENQNTVWPSINSTSDKKKLNSTQWMENGSWVKVKYIGLTYHIPKQWISFAEIGVSVSGTELFTFTKYKGYDPEVSASGQSDNWGGCDFGTFPIPKSVNFGVTVNF